MDEDLPDLSAGIPVFPLPGMTLFPHTHLPLHIFEERYRNLMEDTLRRPDGEHCFAMGSVLPDGAHDTVGHPAVFRYAGVGRIDEYSRMPDGRFMLVLKGVGRVRLSGEREMVNGYRVFDAQWVRDFHPSPASEWERNLGQELKALAVALLREQAEKFREVLSHDLELGSLVDMICGYLPFPAEFKLEQMGTPNVIERAAATISHLERLLGDTPGKPVDPDGNPVPN
jgi:Lon protease-like protein